MRDKRTASELEGPEDDAEAAARQEAPAAGLLTGGAGPASAGGIRLGERGVTAACMTIPRRLVWHIR